MQKDLIQKIYSIYKRYPHISTDTRKELKDTVFFALKGEHFDANEMVEKALEKGAALVLTHRSDMEHNPKVIVVEDTLRTLQELAAFHRSQLKIPIIAITGSNGKTTTKELISLVLAKKFNVFHTPGNLNNHVGVPLSLLMIHSAHEIAVLELGANHVGENLFLTELCQPDIGITTNIGKDHLGMFGSEKLVIEAYREFMDYFNRSEGKLFVCNEDDTNITSNLNISGRISFSAINRHADLFGQVLENGIYLKLRAFYKKDISSLDIQTQMFGDYNIYNVLAALCLGYYFKVDEEKMASAVAAYNPDNNRSQVVQWHDNTIVFDAYNANPSSMRLALMDFSKLNVDSKWVILGDMHELGEFTDTEHAEIVSLLKTLSFDNIILVGNFFAKQANKIDCMHFENSFKLRDWFCKQKISETYILLKGSRSEKLEIIFNDQD